MQLFFMLFIAFCFNLVSFALSSYSCRRIKQCTDSQLEYLNVSLSQVDIENETQIGLQEHWHGIKPESYFLYFNFTNRTSYYGSAEIQVKVTQATSTILINQGRDLVIDYSSISIKPLCPITAKSILGDNVTNCIKTVHIASKEIVILNLSTNLRINETYILSIPRFYQRPNNSENGFIHWSNANKTAASTTTLFFRRMARNVFPSFDHPALKSVFNICIEHPTNLFAASNAVIDESQTIATGLNRKRDYFEATPSISTYLVALALLENYTSMSLKMPNDGPIIEVFAPLDEIHMHTWMLEHAARVIDYLTNTTKFRYPMKRLGFIVMEDELGSMEHIGLISMDKSSVIHSTYRFKIVTHEIVHQWVGNIFTIKNWNELCLQEGLTTYIEWKIHVVLNFSSTLEDRASEEMSSITKLKNYKSTVSKEFISTDTMDCYTRSAFFFHAITMSEGFEVIENFLAKLIEKKAYGTADINFWDKTMEEVSKNKLKNYFTGWFATTGPLYLLISKHPESDELLVRQRLLIDDTLVETARPVPLSVYVFNGSKASIKKVILEKSNSSFSIGEHQSYLVDPDANTITAKIYPASTYLYFFKNQDELINSSVISANQIKILTQEFCNAIFKNVFPMDVEEFNATQLSNLFETILSTTRYGRECACCLKLQVTTSCTEDLIQKCKVMKLRARLDV